MIVNYDGYSYINDNHTDKGIYKNLNNPNYQYDGNKFQDLINQKRYEDAADYISQFKVNDPEAQREIDANVVNLRRQGRIASAIWSRIDKDDKEKFRFANEVFSDGGLNNNNDNYAKKFTDIKDEIGSSDEEKATKLQITFEPKQQTLFGIDWIAPDNDWSIDDFYNVSGLSKNDLLNAGVQITNKDGNTILTFDKSNALANKILYYIPDHEEAMPGYGLVQTIVNYFGATKTDREWNEHDGLGLWLSKFTPKIAGLNDKGEIITKSRAAELRKYRQYIDDALDINDKYTMDNDETKQYTSVLGGWINDDMARLHEMYANGEINDKQLNQALKNSNSKFIYDALASLGSSRYTIYSNGYNDEVNDETLRLMNKEQRAEIIRELSSYVSSPKDLTVMAGEVDGELGCWVTIPAMQKPTKEGAPETPEDATQNRRTQIFIPGLLTEEAQAKLDANTEHRAIVETNLMQDYGYDYPVRDGSKIRFKNGSFYKNEEVISKEDAIREINGAIMLENSLMSMKYNYLNKDDGLLDRNGYEEEAKLRAVAAINELYPNISLTDTKGYEYTIDDIFNHSLPDGRRLDKTTVQFDVWKKIQEIYDMYNQLMKGISYYD